MSRLSDTRALVEGPARGGESHHISTRKIDNGFLIEKSVCTNTGEYKTSTEFSKDAPRVQTKVVGRPTGRGIVGNENIEDTVNYLGRK